jgi:hypothetical protein
LYLYRKGSHSLIKLGIISLFTPASMLFKGYWKVQGANSIVQGGTKEPLFLPHYHLLLSNPQILIGADINQAVFRYSKEKWRLIILSWEHVFALFLVLSRHFR